MLDPQTRQTMDTLASQGVASISQVTPAEARQAYLQRKALTQPDPVDLARVQDYEIETSANIRVTARLYDPGRTDKHGLTVYFHGGGFVIGSIDTHDTLCRKLCQTSGHRVLSVDYRLAPEHPFPAAFDDCLAVTRWACKNATELGIDPARIAVAGDSAGGQLAATVSLALRDDAQIRLAYQLLIYPVTDALMNQPSIERNGSGYVLTRLNLETYYRYYLPDQNQRHDWRASPLLAENLAGLPPAMILTAGFDPLHDEGLAYADRLAQSGVRTEYLCFERQIHGFLPMGRMIDEANLAVDICGLALARALD